MREPDLAHDDPTGAQVDEELGREERAVRANALEWDAREDIGAEELEPAVNVAPSAGEQDADHEVVDGGDDEPAPRVRALDPVSDHRVDTRSHLAREAAEVPDVELQVTVGERDERLRGSRQTRAHG